MLLSTSPGCYYGHLAVGQGKLLWARQSVDQLLANDDTDPALRDKLETVRDARVFAETLGLEVGDQYTSYVAWPGDRVVTTVVATYPRQVEPSMFWFPIIGDAPYKGFFDLARAERESERLKGQGMDVCLIPVTAYSTLGWLADPLTSPMVAGSTDRLVETVIHELVHATVFVKSQPDFNEGAASFIGEEAVVRFYDDRSPTGFAYEQTTRVAEDRAISSVMMDLRSDIEALYSRDALSDAIVAQRREALVASMRNQIHEMPLTTRNPETLPGRLRINDACLALQGTYAADTPHHQRVLDALDGDLILFIARLREAADQDDPRAAFFDI